MTEKKHRLQVFLCHASIDKTKARELYQYLKRRRIRPWMDEEDLVPGQDWDLEIQEALEHSDAIIILLSKSSINKEGYLQKEIKLSLDKARNIPIGRIFLIPARLEECNPPDPLSSIQWVNLFEEDGHNKLMKSLRMRAEQLKQARRKVSHRILPKLELPSKGKRAQTDIIHNEDLETTQGDIRSSGRSARKYQP